MTTPESPIDRERKERGDIYTSTEIVQGGTTSNERNGISSESEEKTFFPSPNEMRLKLALLYYVAVDPNMCARTYVFFLFLR